MLGFTIAGVAGFGGGVVILPVLVWVLGPREAIPILSVAQFVASVVRFWMYRQDTSWPVVRWFSLGAIPIAILASLLYVQTPADVFVRLLGAGMLTGRVGQKGVVTKSVTNQEIERNSGVE